MNRETQTATYILIAIYLYGRSQDGFVRRTVTKAKASAENAAREARELGARIYEATHADHRADLPRATLSRAAVLEIAKKALFPDPKLAAAIALAESGGSTGAVNRSSREYSIGLWQINVAYHRAYTASDMKDPIKNAHAAFKISKGGTDWTPWSAYTKGRYKEFQTGILAP
jgi:hypothetical protein